QPGRYRRQRELLQQRTASRHRVRVPSEEDRDLVLRLLDAALEIRNRLGRRVEQHLGLAYVHHRRDGALLTQLDEAKGVFPAPGSPPLDLELEVELPELEVRGRDVAHEAGHHETARRLRGQQIVAGRLGAPPEPTPEIELPEHVEPARRAERLLELRGCAL